MTIERFNPIVTMDIVQRAYVNLTFVPCLVDARSLDPHPLVAASSRTIRSWGHFTIPSVETGTFAIYLDTSMSSCYLRRAAGYELKCSGSIASIGGTMK